MSNICRRGVPSATCLVLVSAALSGCALVGTPAFDLLSEKPGTPEESQATVNDVVNQIACELASAMVKHIRDPNGVNFNNETLAAKGPSGDEDDRHLWQHLIEDNFAANTNLTLQVTNSEGVNPSLNFIDPYYPIPVPSLSKTTPGSFSGNLTLAVGGQLNADQYRTFNFTYPIDLAQFTDDSHTNI